jgi:hypothetical protein
VIGFHPAIVDRELVALMEIIAFLAITVRVITGFSAMIALPKMIALSGKTVGKKTVGLHGKIPATGERMRLV